MPATRHSSLLAAALLISSSLAAASASGSDSDDRGSPAARASTGTKSETPAGLSVTLPKKARGGQAKLEPKSGLEFVYIPGGRFHYGCELALQLERHYCEEDEKPGRTVSVKAFWMGKSAVTLAAYKKCVDAGACEAAVAKVPDAAGSHVFNWCNWGTNKVDHPINCVNWEQSKKFCTWVGGRLPTAQEWEYAAKGGESRIYPWGDHYPDHTDHELAQFHSFEGTAPVDGHPRGASQQGLLDMAGNVRQWTASRYDASQVESRGGGWDDLPLHLRASFRYTAQPHAWGDNQGFRCRL